MVVNGVSSQINANQSTKAVTKTANNSGAAFGEMFSLIKEAQEKLIKVPEGSKSELVDLHKEEKKVEKKQKTMEEKEQEEAKGLLKRIEKIMEKSQEQLK